VRGKTRPKGESTTEVDVIVGRRLRELRMLAGLSQSDLAATIGLTFQQLQKYERGVNRISASKLYLLAGHLCVPVSTFFVDLEQGRVDSGAIVGSGTGAGAGLGDCIEFVSESAPPVIDPTAEPVVRTREALILARNFQRIRDRHVRDTLRLFAAACATLTEGREIVADIANGEEIAEEDGMEEDETPGPLGVAWHRSDIGAP